MARLSFALVLLSVALLSAPAFAADRKLLQQINIPVTAQCINLLNNDQILNVPNLNVGVIQAIAGVLGGGGQTPSAIFYNTGTDTNACANNQEFNNYDDCGSVVGPVQLAALGQGTLTPCYGTKGRKLLQQVNVPVTVQCLNVLDNDQIANIPNADVQVIGVIASLLSAGGAQAPSALFLNSGSSSNACVNNQEFNNYDNCGSVIGPFNLAALGQATFTPCYGSKGRKLLQQINVPVTLQCINLLDNDQIANIPNANVGVIQALLGLGGSGQAPSALFYNSGTSTNACANNQEFNNYDNCGSIVGPVNLAILGQGTLTPCYGKKA